MDFIFRHLDIRQDSRAHAKVFNDMVNVLIESGSDLFSLQTTTVYQKQRSDCRFLSKLKGRLDMILISDKETLKAFKTMAAIKTIQETNGEKAANRYIISNNQTTLNVMQLYAMLKLVAFEDKLRLILHRFLKQSQILENAPLSWRTCIPIQTILPT